MKPNLGIPEIHLLTVSKELNKLLADEFIVYLKVRNYYWNFEGPSFNELYTFYKHQVVDMDEIANSVAERIRSIGHHVEARLVDYLKLTNLIEQAYTNSQYDQLKNLLGSHETIINNLRRLIPLFAGKHKDRGSSDFATQLLRKHEKMAWLISAHLGGH